MSKFHLLPLFLFSYFFCSCQSEIESIENKIVSEDSFYFYYSDEKMRIPFRKSDMELTKVKFKKRAPIASEHIQKEKESIQNYINKVSSEEKSHQRRRLHPLKAERKSRLEYARYYIDGYLYHSYKQYPFPSFEFAANKDRKVISVHFEQTDGSKRTGEYFAFRNDTLIYVLRYTYIAHRTGWENISYDDNTTAMYFKDHNIFESHERSYEIGKGVEEETLHTGLEKRSKKLIRVAFCLKDIGEFLFHHDSILCRKTGPRYPGGYEKFRKLFITQYNTSFMDSISNNFGIKRTIKLEIDTLGNAKFLQFTESGNKLKKTTKDESENVDKNLMQFIENTKWVPALKNCKPVVSTVSITIFYNWFHARGFSFKEEDFIFD